MCLLTGHAVAISGVMFCVIVLLIQTQVPVWPRMMVSGGGGGPVGRGKAVIARSSPGAGYGHPGHVSWVTAKPHDGFPRSYVL